MMATRWLTPEMPKPFLTAPMVPATWVPCELSSNTGTWVPLMNPQPRMSSMQPASAAVSLHAPADGQECKHLSQDSGHCWLALSAQAVSTWRSSHEQLAQVPSQGTTGQAVLPPLPSSSMPFPGISKGFLQRLAVRSGWLVCTPESITQTAVVFAPVSSCSAHRDRRVSW